MRINTSKMMKASFFGREIAFSKPRKNELGEWVIKVYLNRIYSEDLTIYELTKEDAEATRDALIETYRIGLEIINQYRQGGENANR